MNPLREHAQQFSAFKNAVGALLAGHDPAEFSYKTGNEWELQQSGMSQEAGRPSDFLDQQMQGHDRVPGHKTTVHAHQDSWSLTGDVF